MAKITVRGKQQPIEVNQVEADEIKELLNGSENSNSKIINVGHLTIRLGEIKGIEDDIKIQESKPMFDVNDPDTRKMLRKFERELAEYEYPAFDRWCVIKGYLLNPIYREYIRKDGTKYTKPESNQCRADINIAWEMQKALKVLQAKTNFAQKMELENLNSLKEDLKEKMEMPDMIVDEELDKLF